MTDIAAAERLCAQVAGRDLSTAPIYIVPQSALPDDLAVDAHCLGYTSPILDLCLRDFIPRWRGRGPCFILHDAAIAAHQVPPESVILHELAHCLARRNRGGDGENPVAALRMDAARDTARYLAQAVRAPLPPSFPPFAGHGERFLRVALHLAWRAEITEHYVDYEALIPHERYRLSHPFEYLIALGREPARKEHATLAEIVATRPPSRFRQLFRADVRRWARDP